MFTANIVPGQGFQPLTVYEKRSRKSKSGRAVTGSYEKTPKNLFGIITNASQTEVNQWKQNGHPVTHRIVAYSAQNKAKATDYLKSETGRWFYIRGIKNHGDLNISVTYFVEERKDLAVIEEGDKHEQFGNGCPSGR